MTPSPPPAPLTEAAGLLASGVIFPRRVGLKRAGDPGAAADVLLGFKRGGFSVYCGDAPLLHFDLDGRWQRAFIIGTHYLKGLDTQVRAVDRVREGDAMVLRRRTLGPEEATDLDAAIARQIEALGAELAAGRFDLIPPPTPSRAITAAELTTMLGRITGWDAAAWDEHRGRYHLAYGAGPVPFLPPDCPNPVILHADARVSGADFATLARAVAALLGQRLNGCRDIFMTGPGWLDRPADEVLALLAAVNEIFPIQPDGKRPRALAAGEDAPRLETIHGWLDALPASPPSLAAWHQFKIVHLGRITARVDLRSRADLAPLQALVAHLKAAGIGVGLAWFGAGRILTEQADLAATLPLGSGDLITLVVEGDEPAASNTSDPALLATWKARLTILAGDKGPRVVVYNPDKQWI